MRFIKKKNKSIKIKLVAPMWKEVSLVFFLLFFCGEKFMDTHDTAFRGTPCFLKLEQHQHHTRPCFPAFKVSASN